MKKFISALLLALFIQVTFISISASAQQIRNLNFDEPGIVNPDQPIGWATQWVGHKVSLDSNIVHSGQYSFRSERLPDKKGYGIGRQSIPADLVRGQDVTVKTWIRSKGISNGNAIIRFSVFDSARNVLNHRQIPENGVTGSTDWQQYKTELTVDEAADMVSISVFHGGSGTAWFDDIELEINEKVYNPDTFEPWSASKDEINWLKQNAVPIKTDSSVDNYSDLNKLKYVFNDAELIGLGEATHGTREFFRMKHRLIKWLAGQQEKTIVAIEAGMAEARKINQYVLHGVGNPKQLLADLGYWTWNTQEMLDLIEWIRNFNKDRESSIEFWGFDMQFSEIAADSVRSFIKKADSSFLQEVNKKYSDLKSPSELRGLSQNEVKNIYQSAKEVRTYLQNNRRKYTQNYDSTDVDWVIQYARIVEQSVGRFSENGASRDQSMAENITWIKEYNPNSKVILWAHNDHVKRAAPWMGKILSDRYSEKYRTVGFAFGEGTYSAVLGPDQPVKSFPAPTPIKGSVEDALQSIDIPRFAIDLREAKKQPDGSWLMDSKPFRSIGSIARDDPYQQTEIAKAFDLLIYFNETSATKTFGQPEK